MSIFITFPVMLFLGSSIFGEIEVFKPHGSTGGPRYLQTFYLQIFLFTFQNWSKSTILQSKMDFLSAHLRFAVQNIYQHIYTENNEGNLYHFCSPGLYSCNSIDLHFGKPRGNPIKSH